ncbi:MAG: FimV/HubP family polar landmark protein [Gammaproteobacteria bacterium]
MKFTRLPTGFLGVEMSLTMPRLMLMACLLSPSLLWPSLSSALGLGEIHLNSALNEPMNADIDLIAATPDELTALRASLASREAFTRYGIDRPPFLATLSFKVGKGKDGREALLVRSADAIPEPFVTFLVEVNWARGRLMREYTVLLDPPVYTPGETASSAAPVTAPTSAATRRPPPALNPPAARAPAASQPSAALSESAGSRSGSTYRVGQGDTLTKIARSLYGSPANIDQTMMAMYRANPDAFGGNINILRRGSVLRIPGADDVAALNQAEAISEVRHQMDAWRGASGTPSGGHLRLVTPSARGGTSGAGDSGSANAEAQALKDRVKDLEGQLAESHRLIDIRNSELSALQRKLGTPATAPSVAPVPGAQRTPSASVQTPAPANATPPPAATATPPAATATAVPPPVESTSTPVPTPAPAPAAVQKKPAAAPADTGSWIDWVAANWWVPVAVIAAFILVLVFAAWRRRQGGGSDLINRMDATDVADFHDPTAKIGATRRGDDSFVVEESGEHRLPEFGDVPHSLGDTHSDIKASDDTMSSESAVNLDQGDPLAEADFHMAYGLYDQAADLVRIALEREPDRRDLRLKLLEIYFVWGNKDAFLQTAKGLEATRDRAPAGEWDKIVIMGKQICPDEPLFASVAGSGRGAGALVDLNLEGGENRVDIDLFGDPEGERSPLDHPLAKASDSAATGESPATHASSDLDFTLDAPERGADESPTREMPPRDEPTVESELMNFMDAPTIESPAMKSGDVHDRISSKLGPVKADQTVEVSIDDLGLDLDDLDQTGSPAASGSHLEETDHPSDAPTMVAGLDEKSRRMMAEAESRSRDRDLTELERELEASFIADLDSGHDDVKTAVLGPESAPTVQMPRDFDVAATSRFKSPEFSDVADRDNIDVDSTSKLQALSGDSIDLDLDRLASALGSGDTVEQPRAEDEVFSSEVFEASQRNRGVDLDVGEALNGLEQPTNKMQSIASTEKSQGISPTTRTAKIKTEDIPPVDLEPVTMSEVGTKLDLARAYMDMGDPEGARSILDEVVLEGSASQKQEAQRLIETLPG